MSFCYYSIERNAGHFGTVFVHWQISPNDSSQPLTAGEDFERTEGNATFNNLETVGYIQLMALADGEPEFEEIFRVVLHSVSGDVDSSLLAV